MNKSKIDWCDFTWNPVTGCRRNCAYCYAHRLAMRFCGDVRINAGDPQIQAQRDHWGRRYTLAQPYRDARGHVVPFPGGFEPTLHEYRLGDVAKKKKPATIFVCSMADLFAPGIPTAWIERVFDACKAAPQHNYLFLTKCPERYDSLDNAGILPLGSKYPNFWYGTTVTEPADLYFGGCTAANAFLSAEPISDYLNFAHADLSGIKWIIVGAETGNRRGKIKPRREWIEDIVETAAAKNIPVLLKDSKELRDVWGDRLIQQFPEALRPMPEKKAVPHCQGCLHCDEKPDGFRGMHRACMIGWEAEGYDDRGPRQIPGNSARSSPAWCPKRNE